MARTRSGKAKRIWRGPDGAPVSCVEKLKMLDENIDEIRGMCQDALEDAVLMGCNEAQLRQVLTELVSALEKPFAE